MDSSWNLGSIGIAGPPLRGPSSPRLLAEPPLSPPVLAGASPTASAQPLEPAAPVALPLAPTLETVSSTEPPAPVSRPASSLESLLMRFRLITPDQLDEALREQRETGRDVGAIVVERGWINEDQLARLLSYAPAFPGAPEPADAAIEPEPAQEPDAEREPEHEIVSAPEETAAVEAEADPEPESQPEPDPEPELPSAGPVISADAEASAAPELPSVVDFPPALELIEPELWGDSNAESDETPAVVDDLPEPPPVAEPSVELVPIAPIVSAPEPIAETIAEPSHAVEAIEMRELEPISEATVIAPLPEPVVVPEPVFEPEPVVAAEPAPVAEIAPEPTVVAPEPQTVKFVEPAAIETIARVFVRLSNGERVEAGLFDDIVAAKARAEEVVQQVSNGDNSWPFFGGRYIRPEAIVSVDVDATVVRYA